MNTLLIVGAGATLAEAMPSRPSRDYRPPLDDTFFELCNLARLSGRRSIKQYMQQNYGIDPFSGLYRMEEIFNYIYSDVFSENPTNESAEAYWTLLRMYTKAIARTTNRLKGTSKSGIGYLIRHILRTDSELNLNIVTFNQDLIIEKAIESLKCTSRYSSIPWNLEQTYGLTFVQFGEIHGSRKKFSRSSDESIKILKLHGSLNWIYTVRSKRDPRNSIRTSSKKLHCINDKDIFENMRYRPRNRWIDCIPLVVPPIYEKASRYQRAVGPLWNQAERAIEAAERVIVFGYSFPDTDFASRSMFCRSFHRNSRLTELYIIDTDHSVSSKIGKLTGSKATHHFLDVQTFIKKS